MPLLINGVLLIIFGLLAVYSVSIYESFSLSLSLVNKGTRTELTNYYYFQQQLKALLYIVVAIIMVWKFPIRILKSHTFATVAMIAAFAFQLLVFTPLGDGSSGSGLNGARGWLIIPGLPSIQPSEVFKLAYIFFFSSWLLRKKEIMQTSQFLLNFIVLNAVLYAIFLFIPDFGTILIIGATALIMVWYAGLSLKKTLAILAMGLCAGAIAGLSAGLVSDKYSYIQKRFAYFFTMDSAKRAEEKEKTGWQPEQALMAIGGGGFMGKGYGKGLQKFGYIPEAQSDFIFAAYSEEIGFVGNLLLIFLYCWLFFYFLKHLQHIKDPQSKMIGVGIISILIVQSFVNIGVNIQLIPNTGVTLPFISAGGSSLLISCIELILLYKILKSETKNTVHPRLQEK